MVFRVLTPPENGAGEFSVRKKCQHFQEKLGSRVVQVGKFHVHAAFSATPNKKIQNHREPPYKLCLEKACLLCPLPSSALVMGSFSHGTRLWTFTWSKPRRMRKAVVKRGHGGEREGERGGGRGRERGFRARRSSCSEEEKGCMGLIRDSRADHVSW